jgi:hypothetical protein
MSSTIWEKTGNRPMLFYQRAKRPGIRIASWCSPRPRRLPLRVAAWAFLPPRPANIRWYLDRARRRGPGQDKLNQLRHARFLKDAENVARRMERHRAVLAPKFAAVLNALDRRLGETAAAVWTRPEGGYSSASTRFRARRNEPSH